MTSSMVVYIPKDSVAELQSNIKFYLYSNILYIEIILLNIDYIFGLGVRLFASDVTIVGKTLTFETYKCPDFEWSRKKITKNKCACIYTHSRDRFNAVFSNTA